MLYSLIQTLVCVLLIQGGIYALHLSGNMGSTAPVSDLNSQNSKQVNNMLNVLAAASQQHNTQHTGGGGGSSVNSGGSEGVPKKAGTLTPDFLQLERERLMMLGLAKQKAASSTGHRGRSYITGRVHMTPTAEEEAAASEYPALVMQQSRGSLYGSKITHPTKVDDYESVDSYDGGGAVPPRRRPLKYEYGREVTPDEMDLDAYMELEPEPEPDVDGVDLDIDGYQYLDELLDEQQRSKAANWESERPEWSTSYGGYHGHGHMGTSATSGTHYPSSAFQTLEELEANPPSALQELFDIEQRDEALKRHQHQQQQQQQHIEAAAVRNANNIRLQQKWQRKRAQQQKPLQRNIFGMHQQQQQQQQQPHHYNQQHSKLSIANSEATATKHIGKMSTASSASAASKAAMQSSSSLLRSGAASAATTSGLKNQAQQPSSTNTDGSTLAAAAGVSSTDGGAKTGGSSPPEKQQREKEQLLHPNHKRSGTMSSAVGGGVYSGMQSPFSHSMASQLMLRTARGQRQYDVPQIECPTAIDGMERFACPTPDMQGRYRCIDDHVLCDGFIDCPEGEDENRNSCMFYKTTKAHLDVLADALLRWARG